MKNNKTLFTQLEKYKYALIILALGLALLLVPWADSGKSEIQGEDSALQQILGAVRGVGDVRVISSDTGVVVVCQGAGNAAVRLDIIRAVSSYTGFASDKITILKMSE